MNIKTKRHITSLIVAAVVLPLSMANAADYLFNNNTNNESGGVNETLFVAPGASVQISLQVQLGAAESTSAVDYWMTQSAGSPAGVFTITGRDYTGSHFGDPSATNAQATGNGDTFNNSTGAPSSPDGTPDNQILPRNGPDLGSSTTDLSIKTNGTFQIATFTIQLNTNAVIGNTYTLRTFDYAGFGSNDVTPAHQASINIFAVPEPATWSLMGLGGLGSVGLTWLRARRKA